MNNPFQSNVVAFPLATAAQLMPRLYNIRWAAESGRQNYKATTDRQSVLRQLDSCLQRGLMAIVTVDGQNVGGVHAVTKADGTTEFMAHLEDASWGF